MKSPLAIIFNDAHLKVGNEKAVIDSVRHLIEYAVRKKIKDIIFAGDLFDSRSFQRQSVLQAFDLILEEFHKAGLTLHLFPGNHDKTIYESFDSFLDVYRYHPCVKFNRELKILQIRDVSITLLPFFSDDMLIPMLEEAEGTDVLISHFEMAGSTHLGKVSKKTSINQKLLKKWKKVYLGHYHNWHEISKDIVHLPSLRQSNFGEDSKKGFTILYDDLSYELIQGRFQVFTKLDFDIDDLTTEKIKEIISTYSNSKDIVRLEIRGQESKLKAFNQSIFKDTDIEIDLKYDKIYNIDEIELELPKASEILGREEVESSFKVFCEKKGYSYDKGMSLIRKFFKKKESNE